MIQWYNILMLDAETRYILWNAPPQREYKYAMIMSFDYLFEHFVLYQDCKEDDDKLIFVFSPAVIHLYVEYIWNVFHTGQGSKQHVNGKVWIVSPLVNVNKRKYLPTVVDNTCKKTPQKTVILIARLFV